MESWRKTNQTQREGYGFDFVALLYSGFPHLFHNGQHGRTQFGGTWRDNDTGTLQSTNLCVRSSLATSNDRTSMTYICFSFKNHPSS